MRSIDHVGHGRAIQEAGGESANLWWEGPYGAPKTILFVTSKGQAKDDRRFASHRPMRTNPQSAPEIGSHHAVALAD